MYSAPAPSPPFIILGTVEDLGRLRNSGDEEIRKWFRRLAALCLLPDYLVGSNDILNQVPRTASQQINDALDQFVDYFRWWLRPNWIPVWNQNGNSGPRTTNHAEGFHNSLRSRFPHQHPDLAEFLVQAQIWHNSYAVRARGMVAGTILPRPRRPQDIQVDQRIDAAKMGLEATITQFSANGWGLTDNEIFPYLDHVSYLLGNH
ncbi:MAG: hypothetical protein GY934_24375 [Gammaproteobacteria bacterium]|nr:hypothetical protein [Gammaproteobacteria bacterium]